MVLPRTDKIFFKLLETYICLLKHVANRTTYDSKIEESKSNNARIHRETTYGLWSWNGLVHTEYEIM